MYKEFGRFVYPAIQAVACRRIPCRRGNLWQNFRAGLSKLRGRERMAALCRTKTWSSSFWLLAKARGLKSSLAKVLHRAGGRSLVEHVMRSCAPLKPKKIVTIVGFQPRR